MAKNSHSKSGAPAYHGSASEGAAVVSGFVIRNA